MCTQRVMLLAALALAVGCGDGKKKSDSSKSKYSGNSDLSDLANPTPGAFKKPKKLNRAGTRLGGGRIEEFHKLPFETVKIVFEKKGMTEGTFTAWLADHGATVIVEQDQTKPGRLHNRIIWQDGKTTMWDLSGPNKKVHITRLRSKATELRLLSTLDLSKLHKSLGYEKQAEETVAGQKCEAWKSEKQRVSLCRWNGIDIKIYNNSFKKRVIETVATSIEVGVKIPPELTQPPKGYELPKKK